MLQVQMLSGSWRRRSDGGNHQCELALAFPSFIRALFTATERNVNVRDAFRAPRRMRPACRTLATNALNAACFMGIPHLRIGDDVIYSGTQ